MNPAKHAISIRAMEKLLPAPVADQSQLLGEGSGHRRKEVGAIARVKGKEVDAEGVEPEPEIHTVDKGKGKGKALPRIEEDDEDGSMEGEEGRPYVGRRRPARGRRPPATAARISSPTTGPSTTPKRKRPASDDKDNIDSDNGPNEQVEDEEDGARRDQCQQDERRRIRKA
ncbi:hypothetical protein C0991_001265, partial [Blastosporella zonata]